MKRIHFYLPLPYVERLKALSESTGLSVAELVRRAIEDYLSKKQ